MKTFLKSVVAGFLAVLLAAPTAFAQERPAFRQEELDQMLAPIALYPDSLLSQILMASTYPLEVVQAARWSRSNSRLQGQDAVRAVEPMDWDPSVKSLVAFPQILQRMDEQLDWTQRLGEAFIAQEPQVMETIQDLRRRAAAAGNLGSTEQMRVERQDRDIIIEPAQPHVVYVPYYDPLVVYGPWWWPAYPPVYWGPWSGYYVSAGYAPGFIWGSGIVIGTGFFFGHFSWPHRHVTAFHKHVVVDHRTVIDRRHAVPDHKPVRWQHDPRHRKGVPYRHVAMRDDFRRAGPSGGDARRDFQRHDAAPPSHQRIGERPAGFGDGRRDERREAGVARDRRESAPYRGPAQGNDRRADARGAAYVDRGMRESRPAPSGAQGQDRRPVKLSDTSRVQSRSMPRAPGPAAPAARANARPLGTAPGGHFPQARVPGPVNPPALRGAGDRAHAGRQAIPAHAGFPAARPFASSGNPAPRVAHGSPRVQSGSTGRGGSFR